MVIRGNYSECVSKNFYKSISFLLLTIDSLSREDKVGSFTYSFFNVDTSYDIYLFSDSVGVAFFSNALLSIAYVVFCKFLVVLLGLRFFADSTKACISLS